MVWKKTKLGTAPLWGLRWPVVCAALGAPAEGSLRAVRKGGGRRGQSTESTAASGGDAGSMEFSNSRSVVGSDDILGGRIRSLWLDSIFHNRTEDSDG